jgi:hypothetical protein
VRFLIVSILFLGGCILTYEDRIDGYIHENRIVGKRADLLRADRYEVGVTTEDDLLARYDLKGRPLYRVALIQSTDATRSVWREECGAYHANDWTFTDGVLAEVAFRQFVRDRNIRWWIPK